MAPSPHPIMPHPYATDEATDDQHLYAAWRYVNLSADDAARLELKGLSVAAVLAVFREEWRRAREEAIEALAHAAAAPDTSAPSTRK